VSKLLLTAFALGLVSLDVTGTLLATGAMGAGARNRALVVFGCVSILGTVAFGTALSLIVGPRIAGIDWEALLPHDPTEDRIAAYVELVVGVGLLVWGVVRVWRPATIPPKPSVPRTWHNLNDRRGRVVRFGGYIRPHLRLAGGDRRTSGALLVRRSRSLDVGLR
jgi:hypothetical protein